jgi:hypothetical protein
MPQRFPCGAQCRNAAISLRFWLRWSSSSRMRLMGHILCCFWQ